MRNVRELDIWKNGIQLTRMVQDMFDQLPKSEIQDIESQMSRSTTSLLSNIAEGANSLSESDFCKYLDNALSSSYSLEKQLMTIVGKEWANEVVTNKILDFIQTEQKMLSSFQNSLIDGLKI